MAKWLDKYEQGGLVLKKKTKDNYGKKPNPNNVQASVGPDFVGLGYNIKGRNYSPAWGGQFQNGGKKKKKNIEDQMERWLGHPMQKAEQATDRYAKPGEKQRDNIRHSMAGRFTSEAIQNKLYNIPGISQLAGFIGASAAGLGHELIKPNRGSAKRPYSWYYTVREGAEDQFNNMVGAAIGSTPFINKDQKDKVIKYLSDHNMLTDGYIGKDNIYRKHGMNKKLQNGDTLSEVTVKASKKRKDNVLLHDPQDYEGGHKYSLKKTVTPYKSNRQIRLNTEAVDNPNDIDFLYNYRHTAGDTMDATAVPYEGDRHWNIDRFITDPAFGKGYGKLESADNSMEAERRNVLADMFKYQMYQHPEQSRGKSFRQAKRFVRKEIDPRVSGPYFQSYMREGVYPPGTGGLTTFTNNNPFFAAWEGLQWEETQGNKEYRKNPWDEAKVEEVAKDYLRNIKKLSRKETNEQIKNWKTEAKSKIENYYKPSTVINSDTPAFYSTGDDQKDRALNYPEEAIKAYFDLLKEDKKSQLPNKKIAMGGSIPGAVGFTYARTAGAAPSNGKYAKKTKASAQDGKQVVDNSVLLNFDTSDPAFGYVKESNFVNFDPKNFEGIKQNIARYMNSPLYMERLGKSIPDQEVAKDVQKQRLDNLLSVKLNPKTGDQGTYYNLLQDRVNLGANDFVDNPTIAHEVAHGIIPITNASYGKKNLLSKAAIAIGGLFQPFEKFTESELEKINRPLSGRVTAPNEIYQKAIQEEHYAPQGSKASARTAAGETYGDLTGMRQLLLDNGITTEFGQELTPEMFQKALKNPKISNEPVFQRMKLKFKDEDIIKMNNEVAQLNNAAPLTQAQNGKEMRFYQQGLDFTPKTISKNGSVIKDDMGQWAHPGEITEIDSNDITMEGVDYPVLGISDTGDTKLMQPGQDYKFKGKKVTEFPMMKNGGWLDRYTPKAQTGITTSIGSGTINPTVQLTTQEDIKKVKKKADDDTKAAFAAAAKRDRQNQAYISKDKSTPASRAADEQMLIDAYVAEAQRNSPLAQTFGSWAPGGTDVGTVQARQFSKTLPIVAGGSASLAVLPEVLAGLSANIGGIPGLTGANIINAGFAYKGLTDLPNTGKSVQTAYNDPNYDNIINAVNDVGWNTIDVLPFVAEAAPRAKYIANEIGSAINASKQYGMLSKASKLNPLAKTLAGQTQRQMFGNPAYESFLKYGPTTQPEVSAADQLAQWNKLAEEASPVTITKTGENMQVAGTTRFDNSGMRVGTDYPFAYFSEGSPWYGPKRSASMAKALGQERRIVPKPGADLSFYPAGESSIVMNPSELSKEAIQSYAGRRRVLSPSGEAFNPEAFDVYEPHWWKGFKKVSQPTIGVDDLGMYTKKGDKFFYQLGETEDPEVVNFNINEKMQSQLNDYVDNYMDELKESAKTFGSMTSDKAVAENYIENYYKNLNKNHKKYLKDKKEARNYWFEQTEILGKNPDEVDPTGNIRGLLYDPSYKNDYLDLVPENIEHIAKGLHSPYIDADINFNLLDKQFLPKGGRALINQENIKDFKKAKPWEVFDKNFFIRKNKNGGWLNKYK